MDKLTVLELRKALERIPNQVKQFEKGHIAYLYKGMPEEGWYLDISSGDPYEGNFEMEAIRLEVDKDE